MKVFVTGASGFVGRRVCHALVETGHSVVGLVRSLPDESRRDAGVAYAIGDVRDFESLPTDDLTGCDAIVHLVGIITPNHGSGETFEAVHVRGTSNVVRAAGRAHVTRLVYVSALGADAKSPSEYARTKATAERIVAQSEIPFTIFRPSIILGPGCAFAAQIEQLIRRPPLSPFPLPFVPIPGNGKNLFQPLWIDDLARCIVADLASEAPRGATYAIGGAETVSFNDLVTAFADHMGVKKRLLHVPIPLLFGAAAVMEAILPHPAVTTDQLMQLRTDNICDNAAMREAFGIEPMGFREMVGMV